MQDWVANSDDDYVRIAVQKKCDLAALATLRQQLRTRIAALRQAGAALSRPAARDADWAASYRRATQAFAQLETQSTAIRAITQREPAGLRSANC